MLIRRAVMLILLLTWTPAAARADRVMQFDFVLDAPRAEVWETLTTAEGWRKWAAPNVRMDWRIGGEIRAAYDPNVDLDGPDAIVHHILSYEPEAMYSTRFTAPESFGPLKIAEETWGVTRLQSVGPDRTRVIMTSMGWGEGEEWDEAWAFFEKNNPTVINRLRELFPPREEKPAEDANRDAEAAWQVLERMVGGEWISESRQNGRLLRVRNVVTKGPGDACIEAAGWIGGEQGVFRHAATQVWRDPESGEVRFQNVNEQGAIATGAIAATGKESIRWDWSAVQPGGDRVQYEVEMQFIGDDAYMMRLFTGSGDERRMMVSTGFTRVDEAPARYRPADDNT